MDVWPTQEKLDQALEVALNRSAPAHDDNVRLLYGYARELREIKKQLAQIEARITDRGRPPLPKVPK